MVTAGGNDERRPTSSHLNRIILDTDTYKLLVTRHPQPYGEHMLLPTRPSLAVLTVKEAPQRWPSFHQDDLVMDVPCIWCSTSLVASFSHICGQFRHVIRVLSATQVIDVEDRAATLRRAVETHRQDVCDAPAARDSLVQANTMRGCDRDNTPPSKAAS